MSRSYSLILTVKIQLTFTLLITEMDNVAITMIVIVVHITKVQVQIHCLYTTEYAAQH